MVGRPIDRRCALRAPVPATAIVTDWVAGAKVAYLVEDLSSTGMALVGGPALSIGRVIGLEIRVAGEAPISSQGRVVRLDDRHSGLMIAVALSAVPRETERALERAVRRTVDRLRSSGEPGVLVVETDAVVRQELEHDLWALGKQPLAASNFQQALRWLQEPRMRIDAVLVGPVLAQEAGLELLAHVRDRHPGIRRILVSTVASKPDASVEGQSLDAIVVLPWTRDDLARAMSSGGVGDG